MRSSGSSTPAAALHETDPGNVVMDTGIPTSSMMPTFSPDGTLLVFNDYTIANGHGLALMDYDATTRKAKNYRTLYTDMQKLPGWPFVLPDDRAVVFALGTENDFSGGNVGINAIPGFVSSFLRGLGSWVAHARVQGQLRLGRAAGGEPTRQHLPRQLHGATQVSAPNRWRSPV